VSDLTDRQREVHAFIVRYGREHSRWPTIRDIGDHFGINVNAVVGHLANGPMAGDIVELREASEDDTEVMLRVLAVVEDHVGFKEYGKGRFWTHKKTWRARIDNAKVKKVIRPGDSEVPF
jgi:hypothetical protein